MGTSPQNLPPPETPAPDPAVQIWMPSKHMGNLLMSLRTIAALVDFYGSGRCRLVIDESYRDIITASGISTETLYFPRKRIDAAAPGGKVRLAWDFIRRSRRPRPWIAIAVEGEVVSQRFLPLSGCRHSAGPENRYCRRFRVRLSLDHDRAHVFHNYAAVAEAITGRVPVPGYPLLKPAAEAKRTVQRLLAAGFEQSDRPYAVLHPCATKDYKQWPLQSFARLADQLARRNLNLVVTGAGDFDRQAIEQLMSLSDAPLLSLHNRLSLGQLIALLAGARLFAGNDTGPTHLAAAAGIPVFALFGPTDESLWGPLGENVTILRSDVPCEPGCLRRRCAVNYRCLQTLAPENVLEQMENCL